MKRFWGSVDTPSLRRRIATVAALTIAVGASSVAPAQGQTPAPAECEGIEATVQEIEGEVLDRATLVDQFSTNIDLFTVVNDTATQQIEVDGKPELVEVGERYVFTTITIFSADGTQSALLSSAFGENLSCLTTENPDDPEGEPVMVEIGISTIDDDGETTPIEQPPFLPTPPISARTFFIGFGVFAFVVFLLKFR